ncbi:MAG TPA: hypothetical protein DCM31_04630 [Deferribacteraceae bacterium]|nr:hypothetical protein [Deferribacteraceae bacterium]
MLKNLIMTIFLFVLTTVSVFAHEEPADMLESILLYDNAMRLKHGGDHIVETEKGSPTRYYALSRQYFGKVAERLPHFFGAYYIHEKLNGEDIVIEDLLYDPLVTESLAKFDVDDNITRHQYVDYNLTDNQYALLELGFASYLKCLSKNNAACHFALGLNALKSFMQRTEDFKERIKIHEESIREAFGEFDETQGYEALTTNFYVDPLKW